MVVWEIIREIIISHYIGLPRLAHIQSDLITFCIRQDFINEIYLQYPILFLKDLLDL